MRLWTLRAAVVAMGVMLLGGLAAGPASAHEFRKVGKFNVTVGWAVEPAFAGQMNAVQLFLADAATDKPIVDLGDTLKVDVTFGGKTSDTFTFEPAFEVGEFGEPGDYRAAVMPTRPGEYTFHLTGTIKGQAIDQRFVSGKEFDNPADSAAVQFPVKDPSVSDLKSLIDRQIPRVEKSVAAVKDDTDKSMLLGYIGIGVGALALIVALVRGRGRKAPAA